MHFKKHNQYLTNRMKWRTLPCVAMTLAVIFNSVADADASGTRDARQHSVITYDVLMTNDSRRTHIYSHPNIDGYTEMAMDIPRKQIIVGAKDYVLRLSLSNLSLLEKPLDKRPNKSDKKSCLERLQSKDGCCNYIRVLLLHKDDVLLCGTNAFSPTCSWHKANNLTVESRNQITGAQAQAICPFDLSHNSTALVTSNGDLYSATMMAKDSAILRAFGPSKALITVQFNSKWLDEPEFVSSYEIGDFIYFFFREAAVESWSCGKNIYSRVARVCKNDAGGRFILKNNWTSFQKARLNCSVSGDYPFYYNHLQSTHYVEDKQLIYMVFTTSPNSIFGSAVCVYDMASINKAFMGAFKYQQNAYMSWTETPNMSPKSQCQSNSKNINSDIINAQKYQLMNEAVQAITDTPIATVEQNRWSHIVVEHVSAKHHENFSVVFVANSNGIIEKRISVPYSNQSCLLEEIRPFPSGRPEAITKMDIYQGNLYIITASRIMQIPVERCHLYKTKSECMNAMDPYCGWNRATASCTTAPGGNPKHHQWKQYGISRCPIVDGKWSKWSSWFKCEQSGLGASGDTCRCRSRSCDSPAPSVGGQNCKGSAVQVSKCKVHGRWTIWSEWSSCSSSCGPAVRTRRRECGNPRPAYGGRLCVGQSEQQKECNLPSCPKPTDSPINGGWSRWQDWSECTHLCGGGMQHRNRFCNSPAPNKYGRACVGNDETWRRCNIDACPDKTLTKSTRWQRVFNHRGVCTESRYVVNCKASLEDLRLMRDPNSKEETRPCNSGSVTEPTGSQDVDGQWSVWTDWTPCDKVCGGGIQHRTRSCDNPQPMGNGRDCPGSAVQNKECNTHSCQGVWSCWSEFSACSITCGNGIKWRRRQCKSLMDGFKYIKPCLGQEREQENCIMPSCDDEDGWSEWSLWSECEGDTQTQVRNRKCIRQFPEHCQGLGTQTRACHPGSGIMASESRQEGTEMEYSSVHLAVVAIVTFLVGIAVAVISLYIYYVKKIKPKFASLPKNLWLKNTNEKSNPNLYGVPSVPSNVDLNNKYNSYSTGSLNRGTLNREKMTVKEATLKRDSLMRTNLSLNDI